MNERIKELMDQAGAEELGADLYGGAFIGAIHLDFLEMFAELIVKECADIANAGIDPAESHLIGDDILKHFGVEE